MASTEKNANTFDMTSLSAVNSGYSLMLINNSTNEGQLITMTDLATMILNEIRNQTFTAAELGQPTAATLVGAISGLNSALSQIHSPSVVNVPTNGSVTLTFDGVTAHRFCAFIATSGTSSAVQGLWVIQGYGTGGARYKLENLISGNSASVEISGANITISNNSTAYMYGSVHFLYGNSSYYSVVE